MKISHGVCLYCMNGNIYDSLVWTLFKTGFQHLLCPFITEYLFYLHFFVRCLCLLGILCIHFHHPCCLFFPFSILVIHMKASSPRLQHSQE
ncbi:hypothetical protein ASPFODRAFT_399655 [Aspergillus luchuensis CBS 106.47]|uniref:Uncharacterized protein n=1 Tax=Aspergillus luchuensis (strain CBS 106.47) TaxID=1137211 RepID=A0A1M3T2M8_ASPLC|nr:hypothetical protein ASPFODRAFT_399655 [Aspergillus luchuensis CBS 106.47]